MLWNRKENGDSEPWEMGRGIRQRWLLSPFKFSIYAWMMMIMAMDLPYYTCMMHDLSDNHLDHAIVNFVDLWNWYKMSYMSLLKSCTGVIQKTLQKPTNKWIIVILRKTSFFT